MVAVLVDDDVVDDVVQGVVEEALGDFRQGGGGFWRRGHDRRGREVSFVRGSRRGCMRVL